jgi:ABC-2 type transport system permease protein
MTAAIVPTPQGTSGPQARLLPATWKLLRLQLLIWFNGFRRGKARTRIAHIVSGAFLVALVVGVFFLSRVILSFIRSEELQGLVPGLPDLTGSLPVMFMGVAFLTILLTSFGLLLQALYLSGDMDFLLAAPVPMRAVFLSKLLQAILPNLALISLLALPVLFGLGSAEGFSPLYYPLVILLLIALALAAAGIAGMLVMGVVHFFPARRAAEILGFVGAVFTILCSQSGQFARFSNLDEAQLQQAAGIVTRIDTPWSPITWAGRGLVQIGRGEWLAGAGRLLGVLLLSTVVFGGALVLAERLYYSGWASVSVASTRKRRPATRSTAGSATVAGRTLGRTPLQQRGGIRGSPVWAIVVKDFAVLRRDLRNLSGMITPIIMGLLYAFLMVRGGGEPPPGRGEAPEFFMQGFRELLVFGDIGIALFVGWILSTRLATMAFSQEGKSWWILKSSPSGAPRLLAAKYLVAYLPGAILGAAFVVIISLLRLAPFGDVLFSLTVVVLCYGAITGVNLAFGVLGANFEWDDPRRMVRGAAGCLAALASGAALVLCMGLFISPVLAATMLGLPATAGKLAGIVLGALACAGCAVGPPALVQSRVPLLGE